jgi:NADH:ubiquinone oxidoreductase subunit 6 (subunit J)
MGLFWAFVAFFLAVIAIVTIVDAVNHRQAHSGWGLAGWIVLIVVLPLIGSIIYWATRRTSAAEVEQKRLADEDIRRQAASTTHLRP